MINFTNTTPMDHIVSMLNKTHATNSGITPKQYKRWKKQYMFDSLKGIKYGQSFCKQFNIVDNILQYCLLPPDADRYIQEHYIVE